ncbi:group 1 truncated hemoglobin [Massilia violaceinigra]|uniref:Group 1 truncated hemoglobin n=1 Tax=Massilia violaceinigra TaxID=2045208 RepID=A0A2D2DLY1_9BURK|nr:group 1 truncated hemoglobin [Massilia violaceinigra]ATQ75994.1 group 1 truncated hemoglobin [Massilia violaceinigra]
MNLHIRISAALLAVVAIAGTTACSTPAPPAKPSLFVRLGGMTGVTAVVDDFVSKVSVDPRSKRTFEGVNLPRLKASVVLHVCALSGGPCKYEGDSMALAHRGMAITSEELSVMGYYVDQALQRQGVARANREELESMLDKLGPEILNK